MSRASWAFCWPPKSFWDKMREIVNYLVRMLPAVAVGLLLYWASRPVRKRRLTRKGMETGRGHELGLCLFIMFLSGLLWLTVLPGIFWEEGRFVLRQEGFGKVNLRPFLIFSQSRVLAGQGHHSYFLINFWGNIAMFLPIGFFPALLWRRGRWWKALLTGAGLSLSIELLQIPICRGTDIDDLLLNTLGAVAGYGLLWLTHRLCPRWTDNCKVGEVSKWTT